MSEINSFFEKKDIREFIFTSNCWEEFANKINEYGLKINSNYNWFNNTTDHSTNILISNNF